MRHKSVVGEIPVGGGTFNLNVVPDPFDARDLEYRPRLQPLATRIDTRPSEHLVMNQEQTSSCTGHAVAAMINAILAKGPEGGKAKPISPYMLYYLARRYDEFDGEDDAGSSLRGVLKGWWHHGVCLEEEWKTRDARFDLDDQALADSCKQRPLGAFYRVNARRIDDMQSAVSELYGIVASALIHDGWQNENLRQEPDPDDSSKTMFIIDRAADPSILGGHAFAIVGYNRVGFLVQNSWGTGWGNGGFATLPYEDWLEFGYDAWVARPGVPNTPFAGRTVTQDGRISVAAVRDMSTLRKYVVNLANDGRLSRTGAATSSPAQLRDLVSEMAACHKKWKSKDVAVFAHGGLVGEGAGLDIAQRQYQWWLDNEVYPIFMVWETGPLQTVMNQLADMKNKFPFAAGLDFAEAFDGAIERLARKVSWAWSQMKQNADAASAPMPALPAHDVDWFSQPGATLLAHLLAKHDRTLKIHLVGHSTGAIHNTAFLHALKSAGFAGVQSVSFLAGALTVRDYQARLLPHLGGARFVNLTMTDGDELNDVCKAGPVTLYFKSLLYLVSRGFEKPASREEPLVGMARFCQKLGVPFRTMKSVTEHGAFDEDVPSMNEVMKAVKNGSAMKSFSKVFAGAAGARMPVKREERRKRPRGGGANAPAPARGPAKLLK